MKIFGIPNVEFPEHLREQFLDALGAPDGEARKNQKTKQPISYRIVRRVNDNTGQKA